MVETGPLGVFGGWLGLREWVVGGGGALIGSSNCKWCNECGMVTA